MKNSHRLRRAQAIMRIVDRFAAILERRLSAEFNRLAQEAANRYPKPPSYRLHERNLRRILLSLLLEAAHEAVARTRGEIQKSLPWLTERKLDTEEELRQRTVSIAERQVGRRIVGIANTSRERVANAILRGLEADEAPDEIARRIRGISEFSRARARTIARTESHQTIMSAQFASMEETADELELKMFKVWVSSNDARTRDSHIEANGQKVAMNEKFEVGDAFLDHPGDPEGPPEEVINCRCAIVWET